MTRLCSVPLWASPVVWFKPAESGRRRRPINPQSARRWMPSAIGHSLTQGSEDPSDPKQTVRVLTIILAAESDRFFIRAG